MYRQHQPIIGQWARSKPENLARVYQFVVASARVKFYNVPAVMEEADEGRPGALFSWKQEAWHWAATHSRELHQNCEDIALLCDLFDEGRFERGTYMVRYLAGLPGLNLAKAGFIAQLAYGCAGCLDSVNRARLGLIHDIDDNRRFRMKRQKTPQQRFKLARWYIAQTEFLGGPGVLWDDWCREIARRYPEPFSADADRVSRWHLTCLGIDN